MYDKTPDIAALITSRICHDLASPIGAISNGLELLELSGISQTPEIALLNESVDAANARLQFFRVAYGTSAVGATMAPEAIQRLLDAYLDGRKLRVQWQHLQTIPRSRAKLLLLLVQCMETALPYGGKITVAHCDSSWQLQGFGRLKMDSPVWLMFTASQMNEALLSSQVQFEMARIVALESGQTISVNHSEEALLINVIPTP